jgi:hypothetical protein
MRWPALSVHDRMMLRVNKTATCWLWTGAHLEKGYGRMSVPVEGKTVVRSTHRIAWELYHGPVPDGMLVCHRCDTPACVNPDHLFLGTHSDNHRDSYQKGRRRPPRFVGTGENNPSAKLKEADVIAIRKLRGEGIGCAAIARRFGVSEALVRRIDRRVIWRHL